MNQELIDKYRAARELLSDPDHWTKVEMARDQFGRPAPSADHPAATCWCALGALARCGINMLEESDPIYRTVNNRGGHWSVSLFNDHPKTRHEDVLGLFDETIERLETMDAEAA